MPNVIPPDAQALIVFVKNSVVGKVKTRLAATIGAEKALLVYEQLLVYTFTVANNWLANAPRASRIFVYYNSFIATDDIWQHDAIRKRIQTSGNLGVKMESAFKHVFAEGFRKAIIIGSDCHEITPAIVQQGFTALHKNAIDAVFGPAKDGGYYLLGLIAPQPFLFNNMPWSTPELLQISLQKMRMHNKQYYLLPKLNDIDNYEDYAASTLYGKV